MLRGPVAGPATAATASGPERLTDAKTVPTHLPFLYSDLQIYAQIRDDVTTPNMFIQQYELKGTFVKEIVLSILNVATSHTKGLSLKYVNNREGGTPTLVIDT